MKSKSQPQTLKWSRLVWRVVVVALLAAAAYGSLFYKIKEQTTTPLPHIAKIAESRGIRWQKFSTPRSKILDRNGRPLAISIQSMTLAVQPGIFLDRSEQWEKLRKAMSWEVAQTAALIHRVKRASGRQVVYLQRQLSPELTASVKNLRIKGLVLLPEYRRYYPAGEILAPVVGLTDIDGVGLEGLELNWDSILRGREGKTHRLVNVRGRSLSDSDVAIDQSEHADINLTLDIHLQHLAYRELVSGIKAAKAKSGLFVLVDSHTGEILAMASAPSFNPNSRKDLVLQLNRPQMDLIEPGSTFKPFTVATALQTEVSQIDDYLDTNPGYVDVLGIRFADLRNLGKINLETLLVKSSQVGAAKLSMRIDKEVFLNTLSDLGLGRELDVGLGPTAPGRLPVADSLSEVTRATLGFGYGLSMTPLHLAQAYAILANEGVKVPLHAVKNFSGGETTKVFDPWVADGILQALQKVVKEGTGRMAQVNGYDVAGKTGTSHLVGVNGYDKDRYRALFVGVAPADSPRYVGVVIVNEPNANKYFGGQVAAPIFAGVMREALPYLGVLPTKVAAVRLTEGPLAGSKVDTNSTQGNRL